MKKLCVLIIVAVFYSKLSSAQVLCIYCYNQNDSISSGVNNLVVNGGFENTLCPPYPPVVSFCPNTTTFPTCSIPNWTCTGGGSSTYACMAENSSNFTAIAEGQRAAYFGNAFCQACSVTPDDTSCLESSGCTIPSVPAGFPQNSALYGGATGVSLEQTVTGLTIGNVYVLEFWTGGESGFTQPGLFALDVGFGDTLMRNVSTQALVGIGKRFIVEFIATASSHTIKFTNWGHICTSCTELVLDDVRLYTLAELDASVPHCTVGISPTPTLSEGEEVVPNPFTNELKVKTNSNELSEISIYDLASRKLVQQTFFSSATINTQQLSKGIYFYEIKNKSGVVKKGKVVKPACR